jgi:hypothetical protein
VGESRIARGTPPTPPRSRWTGTRRPRTFDRAAIGVDQGFADGRNCGFVPSEGDVSTVVFRSLLVPHK